MHIVVPRVFCAAYMEYRDNFLVKYAFRFFLNKCVNCELKIFMEKL